MGAQVGSQVDFWMVFRRPSGGFGVPFASFGLPWGSLGAPLGTFGDPKWTQKCEKEHSGAHCVPESLLGAKREGPGPS